jgi:hypothetical protein
VIRVAACFAALSFVGGASADRLFFIPTGKKIPYREVRGDFFFGGSPSYRQGYLGVGIGLQFDAELIFEHASPDSAVASFNFAYNYITPVTDLSPGLSIGIRDGLNKTHDGRSLYVAATFRTATDSKTPADFTLGAGTQSLRGAFVGAMLPLSDRIRFIGEHDSFRWTAGFEFRPFRGLILRTMFRQDQTLFSVGYGLKF